MFFIRKFFILIPKYRYEGKNPNNYIWFNNELWRIIGVFDENSHGVSGQNLVKIIRENPLGGLPWDSYNTRSSDWTTSTLYNILNNIYYNSEDGSGTDDCNYTTTKCDFTSNGINESYREMVENVDWLLGRLSSGNSDTAEVFFEAERGTLSYNEFPIKVNGYIGLMYASDYGYGSLADSCNRTISLNDYSSNNSCAGQSWLYGQGYEWTLTPTLSYNFLFIVNYNGNFISSSAYVGNSVRPVLYLDSNVYVLDGDGSISDPYIIG